MQARPSLVLADDAGVQRRWPRRIVWRINLLDRSLTDDGSQSGQHGPPPVDELALPEPLQAKNLVVRLQGIAAQLDLLGRQLADLLAGLVHGLVLVQLVQVYLQELARLGQTKWVKSVSRKTLLAAVLIEETCRKTRTSLKILLVWILAD